MVQLLLDGLGGDQRQKSRSAERPTIACYHVNARLSNDAEDLAKPRWGKIALLLKYCVQAIWCRFRYGIKNFYYVPAPPLPAPIYRDWIVMLLCRPFFRRLIFHWHAGGMGDWLQKEASPTKRAICRALLGRPDLSIVQGQFNRGDAEALESKQTVVVPYGIPDPCPDFDAHLKSFRENRRLGRVQQLKLAAEIPRGESNEFFEVLYIGLCNREKGLFDAIEAIALVNQQPQFRIKTRLTVAGMFWKKEEQAEFEKRIAQADLIRGEPLVRFIGFVKGAEKDRLFRGSDCLCFPTYYWAETFGLVLAEAMAYGLPIVTTNWRMIPEILPQGYAGIVAPQAPAQLAEALKAAATESGELLRKHFLALYTKERFIERLQAALLSVPQ
jgi:glycosyltransferase involved in cell wall biosynthesis